MAKKPVEKSKSPEMEYILEQMRKNKNVTYREIADGAKAKGLKKIFPISFGRAQLMLGLAKRKKAGRPAKAAAPAASMPAKRGPGRPRKTSSAASNDVLANLNGIVAQLNAMKDALTQIASIAGQF